MERSKHKIRSPRIKAAHIQYAPHGRRGTTYVDEEGRRIYRTSGKRGSSRRYVVMDDGELQTGEKNDHLVEKSNVVYKDETEYETVSETDSEYLVPIRRKGKERVSMRIYDGDRVVTRTASQNRPRTVIKRSTSEERPSVVERVDKKEGSYIVRTRPSSEYMVRRDYDGSMISTRESHLVRSSRPRSEIVLSQPNEHIVSRRVVDDSEDVYVARPSSEKRVVEDKSRVLVRRPRSAERQLVRNEYIDYPVQYIMRRPSTRDVGCQMTTNYVIQQPPKLKKMLRNVQTQTAKKEKRQKIKTATHYYEKVEVVQEPTPREPTPEPRLPTPEPPKIPKPKKKKNKENMQLVVKETTNVEPVYDRVEDLEIVPGSSKIYYEEPKKETSFTTSEPDQQRYAYYEPSEYASPKKIVKEKDTTSDSSSSSSSSDHKRATTTDTFFTVPLKGSSAVYGYNTYPKKRKSKLRKRRNKNQTYDHPRYVELPTRQQKNKRSLSKSSYITPKDSIPTLDELLKSSSRKSTLKGKDSTQLQLSLKRPRSSKKKKSHGSKQTDEYGAILSHGPSFYLDNKNHKNFDNNYRHDPSVMYINPETEKMEPLKFSPKMHATVHRKKKHNEQEEEARYVVVEGFQEHSRKSNVVDNTDKQPIEDPMVIIEDKKYPDRKELSVRTQSDAEDTYLIPVSSTKGYSYEKSAKGKAHMVRVGGGWMKVEHHRNHHTPLKIYEIPRDANDDKFLYIKSRFNTSKKDANVAYKKYREEIVRG